MDTFVEVSCYSVEKDTARRAIKEAFDEVKRIEKLLSKYDPESVVSRVNTLAGTENVKISKEVFALIERAIYYSKISDGAFDITVSPVVDVWRKAREEKAIPDDKTLSQALRRVGYEKIAMDRGDLSIRFLDKDTKIDLGGIAKGYAVDRAREVLSSQGIENALINIGGNIFALGSPLRKDAWQIGVQHPRDKNDIVLKLGLKDQTISTSGDYERFFVLDDKRYSHIIDPRTGRPSEGIMSVTVMARSGEAADALSTAVFVMGAEKGRALIKSMDGIKVFILNSKGDLIE
ncbi:MAG: FAD:protein FMN transferase [Candidatus Omnitrophota bacterium]|nr:FAD:protein FMN transferase [Candidatus Omnitrophota bacterium]